MKTLYAFGLMSLALFCTSGLAAKTLVLVDGTTLEVNTLKVAEAGLTCTTDFGTMHLEWSSVRAATYVEKRKDLVRWDRNASVERYLQWCLSAGLSDEAAAVNSRAGLNANAAVEASKRAQGILVPAIEPDRKPGTSEGHSIDAVVEAPGKSSDTSSEAVVSSKDSSSDNGSSSSSSSVADTTYRFVNGLEVFLDISEARDADARTKSEEKMREDLSGLLKNNGAKILTTRPAADTDAIVLIMKHLNIKVLDSSGELYDIFLFVDTQATLQFRIQQGMVFSDRPKLETEVKRGPRKVKNPDGSAPKDEFETNALMIEGSAKLSRAAVIEQVMKDLEDFLSE